MYCVKKMTEDLYWVGASERRLNLFENAYPLTNGVSYNSYLLLDEKTVLIDTVDKSVSGLFFENVDHVLSGRKLDYLIVQHMEPDHAATIGELVLRHPELTIVCNAKTRTMMQNFFTFDLDSRVQLVKEMDTLTTGRHTFAFVMAPMVHWPEVMVSYDTATKTLYSADAFGTFGALNGNLYADEVNFRTEWLADARRYYTNIVGKYGTQVQALLKKAAGLEIEMICPLHGPVWRKDIAWFLDKYIHWATYTPEDDAVVIAYASVYGGTENAPEAEPLRDGHALRRIEAEMRVGKKRHLRQKRAENAEKAEIADDDRVHAAALRAQGKARGFVQLVLADGDVEREIRAAAADAAVAHDRLKFAVRNVLRPAAAGQILKAQIYGVRAALHGGGDGLRRPGGSEQFDHNFFLVNTVPGKRYFFKIRL